MTDEQREILQRAHAAIAAVDELDLEADIAARRERRLAGLEPREWQPPPQEPAPRATAAKRAAIMSNDEKKELIAWLAMHARDVVRDEVARALRAREAGMADAIGRELATERAKFREAHAALVHRIAAFEQRAASDDDGALFDLSAERRRRRGTNG